MIFDEVVGYSKRRFLWFAIVEYCIAGRILTFLVRDPIWSYAEIALEKYWSYTDAGILNGQYVAHLQ